MAGRSQPFYCAAANEDADATQQIADGLVVKEVTAHNAHSDVVFLQLFAGLTPDVGTDAPAYVIPLPVGVSHWVFPEGLLLATSPGISFAVTSTADGAVAPGADAVVSIGFA